MPGHLVKIGPWPRGLVNTYDQELMPDDALIECLNFNVEDDGTLKPRPSFRRSPRTGLYTDGQAYLLGYSQDNALIGMAFNGAGDNLKIFKVDDPSFANSWQVIADIANTSARIYVRSIIPYNNVTYYFNAGLDGGFYTSTNNGTFSAWTAGSPPIFDALLYKGRVFGYYGNTIYFSKATAPNDWTAPDGGLFLVDPSTDVILGMELVGDQIYIFKRKQTYIFSFSEDPTLDGYLRRLSDSQGAESSLVYKNNLFVVNYESVYQIVNGTFIDVAPMFKFPMLRGGNIYLNIINDRLVLSYYGGVSSDETVEEDYATDPKNYKGTYTYAMNLNTQAWSEWNTDDKPYADFDNLLTEAFQYYDTAIIKQGYRRISYMKPGLTDYDVSSTSSSMPRYYMRTKQFNFGTYSTWKRLFYWIFDGNNTHSSVTYNLRFNNTPYISNEKTVQTNSKSGLVNRINSISARFRSMSFEIDSPAGGDFNTKGPLLIRGIMAKISTSKTVSK